MVTTSKMEEYLGGAHKYALLASFQSKKLGQPVSRHFDNFYKFLK